MVALPSFSSFSLLLLIFHIHASFSLLAQATAQQKLEGGGSAGYWPRITLVRGSLISKKGLKKLCRVPGNLLATRTFHVASSEASSLNRLHTCKQKSQLEAIGWRGTLETEQRMKSTSRYWKMCRSSSAGSPSRRRAGQSSTSIIDSDVQSLKRGQNITM